MPPLHRLLPLLLAALLTLPATADPERWYVLEMQGQRAGWLVETRRSDGDEIISASRTHLTIRRADTEITLEISTTFRETAEGKPLAMTATTNLGASESTDNYTWGEDGVTWLNTQGEVSDAQQLAPPEGPWLTPAAASEYLATRLKAGAQQITTRTIDPLNGLDPVITTRTGFETANIEVLGRSVEAIRCTAVSSLQPDTTTTEYLDHKGRLLLNEMRVGGIAMTIIAADRELATADLDPPELMRALFVPPDRPIDDPYQRARAAFTLSATEGELPDIPSTGSQRVERLDATSVRITRDLAAPPVPGDDAGSAGGVPTTASSAMLTADDPRVAELARAALTAAPEDAAERAERLRRFVHRHIRTKDLSVGFASAAETARTREGDCTEHAVLLAAMCRADGIPARVVSGLIYADRFAGGEDIFGYHMWTQALLPTDPDGEPRWTDLDATLPDPLPMTATHIALDLPDLEGDNRINALVQLAPLMGRLAITVESVE